MTKGLASIVVSLSLLVAGFLFFTQKEVESEISISVGEPLEATVIQQHGSASTESAASKAPAIDTTEAAISGLDGPATEEAVQSPLSSQEDFKLFQENARAFFELVDACSNCESADDDLSLDDDPGIRSLVEAANEMASVRTARDFKGLYRSSGAPVENRTSIDVEQVKLNLKTKAIGEINEN